MYECGAAVAIVTDERRPREKKKLFVWHALPPLTHQPSKPAACVVQVLFLWNPQQYHIFVFFFFHLHSVHVVSGTRHTIHVHPTLSRRVEV